MAKFRYKAIDKDNQIVTGAILEDDLEIAKDVLSTKGYQVIHINRRMSVEDINLQSQLKYEQLANFCGEIGTILDAGVSIIRGLEILYEQARDKSYKKIIRGMLLNVKKGMNLSLAMEKTGVFPELLVDMVESGEISSHLVDILYSMEDFYGREAGIRSKIRGAAIYPIILLVVSVVMVLFFNLFVFSEIKKIFVGMSELPTITRVFIGGLDYLNDNPLVVLGAVIGVVIFFNLLGRIPIVKFMTDRVSLRLPIIGKVKRDIISARVTSSMAIFIQSAVPLTKVLGVVESIAANKYISSLVAVAKEEIVRGRNISDAFEEVKAFDTMMVQMIRIGEETGKLEEMLFKLSDIYQKKSNIGIERLVAMIEPVFTLVVGLIVGVIIVAMAMPIFDMSSLIG